MGNFGSPFRKRLVRLLLVFLFFFPFSAIWAQVLSPRIRVVNRGIPEDLKVETASVSVRIVSFLAEVTRTMTFRNPHPDALVGEFKFQLPVGAAITGYALDIQGKMVDGVIVEQQRARDVFQQEVSKRIDPGYVEMQEGNTFSTRVFPIPPYGVRTISLKYVMEPEFTNTSLIFRVPIWFEGLTQAPSFNYCVFQPIGRITLSVDGQKHSEREFFQGKSICFTEVRCEKSSKEVQLSFRLKSPVDPIFEQSENGLNYFAALNWEPPRKRDEGKRNPKFSQLNLLWDASASRRNSAIQMEIEILQKLIRMLNEDKLLVRVWTFRNVVASPKDIIIRRGNTRGLKKILERIQYDGATNLGELSKLKNMLLPNAPAILFTDGYGTIGCPEIPKIGVACFTFAKEGSPSEDRLSAISGSNGGLCFSPDKPLETVIQDIQCRLGNSSKSALRPGQYGREVVSKTLQGPIPVSVTVGQWEPSQVAENVKGKWYRLNPFEGGIEIPDLNAVKDSLTGGVVRKYWAILKIRQLLPFPEITRNEIVSLSENHGIVSNFTSLMVLETLDQYLEHQIRPPKNLPEMRASYDRRVLQKKEQDGGDVRKEFPGIQALKFLFFRLKLNLLQANLWKKSLANPGQGAVRGTLDPVTLTVLSLFGNQKSPDNQTGRDGVLFRRDLLRMSWAHVVAQCLAEVEVLFERDFGNRFISKADLQLLEKLTVEFADELAVLGVKVTSLEDDMEVVRIGSEIDADHVPSNFKTPPGSPIPNLRLSKNCGRELRNTPSIFRKGRYFQMVRDETQPLPFYSDCSKFFFLSGDPEFAIQVMSNYLELSPFDPGLSRAMLREMVQSNSVPLLSRVLNNELQFLSSQEILDIWLDSPWPIRNLILTFRFGSIVCGSMGLINNDPVSIVQALLRVLRKPIIEPLPCNQESDLRKILKTRPSGRLTVVADSDCGPNHFEIAVFKSGPGRMASSERLSPTLARQTLLYLFEGTYRKCSVEDLEPGDYEIILVSNGLREFISPANVKVAIQFQTSEKKLEYREFRLSMSGYPEVKRVSNVHMGTGYKD